TNSANNIATDTNTLTPIGDLVVPKVESTVPGTSAIIAVSNGGPIALIDSSIPLPTRPFAVNLVFGGYGAQVQAELAWLSGFVFLDHNNDGHRADTEPGIPNVSLTLFGMSDTREVVIRTTVTGPDGYYIFENLPPGIYDVVETQPEGYL